LAWTISRWWSAGLEARSRLTSGRYATRYGEACGADRR
jgi:hypothetical protein